MLCAQWQNNEAKKEKKKKKRVKLDFGDFFFLTFKQIFFLAQFTFADWLQVYVLYKSSMIETVLISS